MGKIKKGKYTKWLTDEGLQKIEEFALIGLTDEQIAHNMGISRSSLAEWKKRFPVINQALQTGKEVVDRQVENALVKRALGYQYTQVIKKPNETIYITKEYPPDTLACIFWLKNRKPLEWANNRKFLAEINGLLLTNARLMGPQERQNRIEELKKMLIIEGTMEELSTVQLKNIIK